MTLLEAVDIHKNFDNHKALSGVSIKLNEGEVFGLLGPNGAGKTTLIRIITGITKPDEGKILFSGKEFKQDYIKKIGYLPEERGLYKKMKVGEQSIYFARLKGMSKNDAKIKLKYWFDKFDILMWWDKKVEELSKGMQQKVQFITTVLHEPEILIFDEPFSGFDPVNQNLIKKEILELKNKGASIIFSTHNMASVEQICDRAALINKSEKILDGTISEIKKQYKTEIYEIVFEGNFNKFGASLNAYYDILEITSKLGKTYVKVRLKNGAISSRLITDMLKYGKIISFNELIPSMDDIFIKLVENKPERATNE